MDQPPAKKRRLPVALRPYLRAAIWAGIGTFILVISLVQRMVQPDGLQRADAPPLIIEAVLIALVATVLYRLSARGHALLDLDSAAMLTSEKYYATRALEVRHGDATGYYVELDHSSVLFIGGSYLRHYDGSAWFTFRRFPCTDFSILRHQTTDEILGLDCTGTALSMYEQDKRRTDAPFLADGTVITDRTFDEIKAATQPLAKR